MATIGPPKMRKLKQIVGYKRLSHENIVKMRKQTDCYLRIDYVRLDTYIISNHSGFQFYIRNASW